MARSTTKSARASESAHASPEAAGGSEGSGSAEEVHRRARQAAAWRCARGSVSPTASADCSGRSALRPSRRTIVATASRSCSCCSRSPVRSTNGSSSATRSPRTSAPTRSVCWSVGWRSSCPCCSCSARGLVVPASVVRARQRTHRHRLRAVRPHARGFCHIVAGAPIAGLLGAPAEGRHARSQRGGRSVRVDARRSRSRYLTAVGATSCWRRCLAAAQRADPHQDAAEPYRSATRRPVRVDVRRGAHREAGEGCSREGLRSGRRGRQGR